MLNQTQIIVHATSQHKVLCGDQTESLLGTWQGSELCSKPLNAPWCSLMMFLAPSLDCAPEGRLGMSDVPLLCGISGLSFDSSFLSPLLFFLPSPLALSVLSFFC